MSIRFKISKLLQEKTNAALHVEVQGDTVQECIADLVYRYPQLKGMILDEKGGLLLKWMVSVNDTHAACTDISSYAIHDGDTITLLPMVTGG